MIRLKCTVAYVGRAYDGWQSQKLGLSVQENIEAALHDICGKKTNITASGRTDAGVNAAGQVFHFDTERDMTPRKWMGALNGHLPDDIRILEVEIVPRTFHARYSVRWKRYDYCINLGPYDVFSKDWAYQSPVAMDPAVMEEASRYLIGTHDFTSFNSSPLSEYPDQVRTIRSIRFTREGNILRISYEGKGFLRYMVRMMTAALMEAGRGKTSPEHIRTMLEAKSKTIARKNAAPNGLTLQYVDYFDILALNENGMYREFLMEDTLPHGFVLEDLERRVRENVYPRAYALTTRHSQELLGTLLLEDETSGKILLYQDAEDTVMSLQEGLRERLGEAFDPVMIHGADPSEPVSLK